jgi:hypothetical protein
MKVSEAPERLYIALDTFTEDGRTVVLDHCVDYPICTEYTCTDAFIEKACEWLKEQDEMIGISFIEDFILRFKNYMKRE